MRPWRTEWIVEEEGGATSIPAVKFLKEIPNHVSDQLLAILKAVRSTGPDSWKSKQTHCAMHGDLAHLHEVRDKHDQILYRLFICWLREERIVVVIDGRQKRNNTKLSDADYRAVAELAERINENPRPFATFDDAVELLLETADQKRDTS